MPCKDCKDCIHVVVAKFRLKTDSDNDDAVGPGGMTSLGQTMDMLRENENFLQQALKMDNWFAFAPNGRDDRITSNSKYVLLAKVVPVCELAILMNSNKIAWPKPNDSPRRLHGFATVRHEIVLSQHEELFSFLV